MHRCNDSRSARDRVSRSEFNRSDDRECEHAAGDLASSGIFGEGNYRYIGRWARGVADRLSRR